MAASDLVAARRWMKSRELSQVMSTTRHLRSRTWWKTCCSYRIENVGIRRADGNIRRHRTAACSLYLPAERVTGIIDEIRGPAGRNMWEKLSNVQEECSPTTSRTNIRRPLPWCCRS